MAKYVQKFFSWVVLHMTIFVLLARKGVWVFPKIKLVIRFMMSQLFHFQLPYVNKFEFYKTQKSCLGETKNIFHNFLRALFGWNIKY